MTDRPIIFSAPMVRALLDGRKTQTRRLLNQYDLDRRPLVCTSAEFGDRLWVRESWKTDKAYEDLKPSEMSGEEPLIYLSDDTVQRWGWKPDNLARWGRYRPGMFMPRWASRLTLEVTDVRVQHLQDISREDCVAEGCSGFASYDLQDGEMPEEEFRALWDSLKAERAPWSSNPWVYAVTFTVTKGNIDQ